MKIGFGGLLTLLFIAFKMTGVIAWSWWWVLSPLWIPFALAVGLLAVMSLAAVVVRCVLLAWRRCHSE